MKSLRESEWYNKFIKKVEANAPLNEQLDYLNKAIHFNYIMRAYNEAAYLINHYKNIVDRADDPELKMKFYLYSMRVFNTMGVWRSAIAYFKKAEQLKDIVPNFELWLKCLYQYSFIMSDLEKYEKAWSALEIIRKRSKDVNMHYNALKGLIILSFKLHRFDEARKFIEKAFDQIVQIKRSAFDKEVERYKLQWHRATLYYYLSDYEKSLQDLIEVAHYFEEIGTPSYWIYFHIALNYEKLGDYVSIIQYLTKSIELIEQDRSTIANNEFRRYYLQDRLKIYNLMLESCAELGEIEQYFYNVQRSRARALNERLLSPDFLMRVNEADTKYLIRLRNMLDEEYNKKNPDKQKIDEIMNEIHNLYINSESNLISSIKEVPIKIKDIKETLEKDEAFIDFYYTRYKLIILVIRKNSYRLVKTDIPESDLIELVKELREEAMSIRGRLTRKKWLFEYAYNLFLKKIEDYLMGVKRLYYITNGLLHLLPVSALYDGQKFLIEKCSIMEIVSLNVFKKQRKKTLYQTALGVIDPLGDLPFTHEEERVLKSNFERVKILEGDEANQKKTEKEMPKYDIVHFACHGYFDRENPFFSYLLLSHSRGGLRKNKFEVNEIMRLDLSKVSLCVLSACESGVIEIERGDEMEGLPRAFIIAGVKNVIVVLWSVWDTIYLAQFFKLFYKKLVADTIDRAFQLSVDSLVAENVPMHIWAAFKLIINELPENT